MSGFAGHEEDDDDLDDDIRLIVAVQKAMDRTATGEGQLTQFPGMEIPIRERLIAAMEFGERTVTEGRMIGAPLGAPGQSPWLGPAAAGAIATAAAFGLRMGAFGGRFVPFPSFTEMGIRLAN